MRIRGWAMLGASTALLAACGLFPPTTIPVTPQAVSTSLPPAPPWPAPSDPVPGLKAAGIQAYIQNTYDTHIHAHLDVYYQGQPVTVPAGLGIDPNGQYIAPLHTHTPTGVLHIEAPTGKTYTLSQVFTVWGASLQGASAYDNGHPVADPGGLVLQDHHEIVVLYGQSPARIPTDYNNWLCIDLKLCE